LIIFYITVCEYAVCQSQVLFEHFQIMITSNIIHMCNRFLIQASALHCMYIAHIKYIQYDINKLIIYNCTVNMIVLKINCYLQELTGYVRENDFTLKLAEVPYIDIL